MSVIIPARNEALNISGCIDTVLAQDYPAGLLEIIVVDDHSTDDTAAICATYAAKGVQCLSLSRYMDDREKVVAYKKKALAAGIAHSTGELIVTTDADCVSQPGWIKNIAAVYQTQRPQMIVGPVDFTTKPRLVEVFQSLDFMSMQGITVASLQMNLGHMCNGANLAFTRSAYEAVGGYGGVEQLASGDDYLLMMKINKRFPGGAVYLKSRDAIVKTAPQPDWKGFFRQRIRWASKSGKYDDKKMTAVLSFVYLVNFSFLVMAVVSIIAPAYIGCLVLMLLVKTISEAWYLSPVSLFYRKNRQMYLFPFLQPLHIAYIISAGLLGFFGKYEWKGRAVH